MSDTVIKGPGNVQLTLRRVDPGAGPAGVELDFVGTDAEGSHIQLAAVFHERELGSGLAEFFGASIAPIPTMIEAGAQFAHGFCSDPAFGLEDLKRIREFTGLEDLSKLERVAYLIHSQCAAAAVDLLRAMITSVFGAQEPDAPAPERQREPPAPAPAPQADTLAHEDTASKQSESPTEGSSTTPEALALVRARARVERATKRGDGFSFLDAPIEREPISAA